MILEFGITALGVLRLDASANNFSFSAKKANGVWNT
jgi:hypothetical protein